MNVFGISVWKYPSLDLCIWPSLLVTKRSHIWPSSSGPLLVRQPDTCNLLHTQWLTQPGNPSWSSVAGFGGKIRMHGLIVLGYYSGNGVEYYIWQNLGSWIVTITYLFLMHSAIPLHHFCTWRVILSRELVLRLILAVWLRKLWRRCRRGSLSVEPSQQIFNICNCFLVILWVVAGIWQSSRIFSYAVWMLSPLRL